MCVSPKKRVCYFLIFVFFFSACGKKTDPYLPVEQYKGFIVNLNAFYRDNVIVFHWEVDKNVSYDDNIGFQILGSPKNNCLKCQKNIVEIKKKISDTQNLLFDVSWKRYKDISFRNIENFYEVKIPISSTQNIFFSIKENLSETEKIIFFPPLLETYIPEAARVIEIKSIDKGNQRVIYVELFHHFQKKLFFDSIEEEIYYIFFKGNAIYPFKRIAIRDNIIKLSIEVSSAEDENVFVAVENAAGNQSSKVLIDIDL